ncbi:MAG: hypothetical protein QNK77_03015 [Crocinitomicaceae bacterium]
MAAGFLLLSYGGDDPCDDLSTAENAVKCFCEKTTDLFYAWSNTWKDGTFKNWDITSEIASSEISGLFIQGEKDQNGTSKQLQLIKENFGGNLNPICLKTADIILIWNNRK